MRKLISLLIGFAIGAVLGGTLVLLFSPVSGKEVKDRLRDGVKETFDEARTASQTRRAELEAELAKMRGDSDS